MDIFLFRLINNLPHFTWLDALVIGFANIGVNEIFIPLFLTLAYGLIFKKHKVWQGAFILILAFVFVNYFVGVIKPIFHRPKPFTVLKDVHILSKIYPGYSFPSFSAANVAVIASYIYFLTRKNLILWLAVIFILGVCRVYQGIHYPSDVLAGWAIGISVAWLSSIFLNFIHSKLNLKNPGKTSE